MGSILGIAIGGHPLLALIIGMLLVALLCRLLRIDAAARSACVSAAIVLMKDPGGVLGSSEMRVAGVLLGCAVALIVTMVASLIERMLGRSAQ